MKYVLRINWSHTRFWLVGPFDTDEACESWGDQNCEERNGWDWWGIDSPEPPDTLRIDAAPEPYAVNEGNSYWLEINQSTDTTEPLRLFGPINLQKSIEDSAYNPDTKWNVDRDDEWVDPVDDPEVEWDGVSTVRVTLEDPCAKVLIVTPEEAWREEKDGLVDDGPDDDGGGGGDEGEDLSTEAEDDSSDLQKKAA